MFGTLLAGVDLASSDMAKCTTVLACGSKDCGTTPDGCGGNRLIWPSFCQIRSARPWNAFSPVSRCALVMRETDGACFLPGV